MTPAVEAPDPCSAPKQRKLDEQSVDPDSLLGIMLRQDQSIYCQHNDANGFGSLSDVAFDDSRATVSVPGDVWQHAAPRPAPAPPGNAHSPALVKSEALVQDVLETLQQILGDEALAEAVEVQPEELQSWESTLLRMSEMSDDLNDILNHDVLSYVEEQLQKEDGLLPACLTVDLQGHEAANAAAQQGFDWLPPPAQGQNGVATLKLSHMELQQTLDDFAPLLLDSCAQTQNKLRATHARGVPLALQDPVAPPPPLTACRTSNPLFGSSDQWSGFNPNNNHVDGFVRPFPR